MYKLATRIELASNQFQLSFTLKKNIFSPSPQSPLQFSCFHLLELLCILHTPPHYNLMAFWLMSVYICSLHRIVLWGTPSLHIKQNKLFSTACKPFPTTSLTSSSLYSPRSAQGLYHLCFLPASWDMLQSSLVPFPGSQRDKWFLLWWHFYCIFHTVLNWFFSRGEITNTWIPGEEKVVSYS